MSTQILADFKRHLREFCDARDVAVSTWSDARPTSRNILMIETRPDPILLYVKVRSEPPGFWGLTANRISELTHSGLLWYTVLLLGSPATGYVVSGADVDRHMRNADWTLSGDGDYKINEGIEIDAEYRFESFEVLMNRIFG